MPDDKPPLTLEDLEDLDTDQIMINGVHVSREEARRMLSPQPPIEIDDEPTPATVPPMPTTSPRSPWSWLLQPIGSHTGALSPLAYVAYGILTITGATAAGGLAGDADHSQLASDAAVQAAADAVAELSEAVAEQERQITELRAALEAHQQQDGHPGLRARVGRLETDIAVNARTIEIHHQRGGP